MIFFTLRKSFLLFFLLLLLLCSGLYSAQHYLASTQAVSYQVSALQEEALETRVALFEDDYQLITSLQSYIATGDPRYEQAYQHASSMAEGEIPRSNGKKLDIFDFIEKVGIPKDKLDRLYVLIDVIANIEEEVFNTVKGKYKDSDGEYTIQGTPNLARAIQIVHSPEYVKDNEEYRAIIHEFLDGYIDQLVVKVDEAEANAHFAEKMEGVMLLIMLVCSILILYWLYKTIVNAIQKSLFIANRLADGDLTAEISINRNDEIGHLMKAMNGIGDGLNKVVKDVRLSVHKINTASQGIYEDSTHLSAKAEEQAANLEKAASAMEELTSTVKLNADNVKQANDQAAIAADIATEGGQVVSTVVDTMAGIKESSSKIAEIITTIDGIAFQTNILALNAAVEAARAGEQGRGFAVVASEVRTLAKRSAEAAKEISSLITDSVARVEEGAKQVDDAGNMMEKIVDSVKMVATIMKEITTAGHEQSIGIEEINIAVSRMDKMTQQNVTMVEKAAVSAKSLLEQADYLTAAVKVFKMHEDEASNKHEPLLLEQKKDTE